MATGRLDGGPGGGPDRRAQRRAAAIAAARLHRRAAGNPARGRRGEQDGPGRLPARRCSTASARSSRRTWIAWGCGTRTSSRSARWRATTSSRAARRMPWYDGPSLLEHLETVPLDGAAGRDGPLRFPVQYVLRPDSSFRGYAGQIVSGALRPGDHVMALPSGRTTRVQVSPSLRRRSRRGASADVDRRLSGARTGRQPRRHAGGPAPPAPRLAAVSRRSLVWMHQQPLRPGRPYLLKHTTQQVTATVTALRHRLNVNTLERGGRRAVGVERNRPWWRWRRAARSSSIAYEVDSGDGELHPDRPVVATPPSALG